MTQSTIEIVGRYDSRIGVKVLAIGAGSFLTSLVKALFESGLSDSHVTSMDTELIEWTTSQNTVSAWRARVQPFDWILYFGQQMKVEQIQAIQEASIAEKKSLLIAACIGQTGFVGPLVNSDSLGSWDSARRRLHRAAIRIDPMASRVSLAATAMLANVIVFDMYRTITTTSESESKNRFFLLDLRTLEGSYHSFLPHPLITNEVTIERVRNWEQRLGSDRVSSMDDNEFLSFTSRLTSPHSGIFHLWEEGDLSQLPLSQCRIQPVDPLSEGLAEMLPVITSAGLTHMEARNEAGLAGIEAYVTRLSRLSFSRFLTDQQSESIDIGAGATFEEAVCRGLQKCLTQLWRKQGAKRISPKVGIPLSHVEDPRSLYYLRALETLHGVPKIRLGEDVHGFPVVWIGMGESWYSCVGLNRTLALRTALQQALLSIQNQMEPALQRGDEMPTPDSEIAMASDLRIKDVDDTTNAELIQRAISVLKRNQKQLIVFDIKAEFFLNEHLGGLLGFMLGEEEVSG
ncbi:bacteriocin maturation protein [Cohnella herbarum]|uniref:Bacteriocin maturation protein n=1 Tax=Cohnella herbarum TaxID=2728023 RepID=A0A7Z2VID0_9BACL|nr:bacteriocin maturation protein [Cohnella herbarum]QJD83778.1 bacteriocin maturation protein [Cohnella herbarum]